MFEVEYAWDGWVKKDGVNANLVRYDLPTIKYTQCPRLST